MKRCGATPAARHFIPGGETAKKQILPLLSNDTIKRRFCQYQRSLKSQLIPGLWTNYALSAHNICT
jgi:hypothetical protein